MINLNYIFKFGMQTGCMTSFLLFLMLKLLNKGVFKEKGKQNLILLLFDHELDNFFISFNQDLRVHNKNCEQLYFLDFRYYDLFVYISKIITTY